MFEGVSGRGAARTAGARTPKLDCPSTAGAEAHHAGEAGEFDLELQLGGELVDARGGALGHDPPLPALGIDLQPHGGAGQALLAQVVVSAPDARPATRAAVGYFG